MRGKLASTLLPFLLLAPAFANPLAEIEELERRQSSCPKVHVFGARETTAPAGYGTSQNVVNSVVQAYSGTTSEAINYPACGGQSSCGGVSYGNSVVQGITAVANAVNSYNQKCPNTVLVLVGYSQGGQIIDDAYCGGGDTNEGYSNTAIPISTAAQAKIAAAILMGDPRHIPGLSYNVGTCQASGFAPRPSGFQCPHAANIQSYCDSADPYCCNGNSSATHQGYANEYGSQALAFIKKKVDAMLSGSTSSTGDGSETTTGGSTPATSDPSTGSSGGATVSKYGQCGGQGYTGSTACESGTTCTAANQWYSQCL